MENKAEAPADVQTGSVERTEKRSAGKREQSNKVSHQRSLGELQNVDLIAAKNQQPACRSVVKIIV